MQNQSSQDFQRCLWNQHHGAVEHVTVTASTNVQFRLDAHLHWFYSVLD